MLWQSTLAEYREGTLYPSRFGVWSSLVLPVKGFTMNRWKCLHGGLTLPWDTAQSRSLAKDVANHFLQCNRPALKKFPIIIVGRNWTTIRDWYLRYLLHQRATLAWLLDTLSHSSIVLLLSKHHQNWQIVFDTVPTSWNVLLSQVPSEVTYRDGHMPLYERCVG